MAKEIERKYLVTNDSWKDNALFTYCKQGYINCTNGVIRARIMGDKAYFTIKSTTVGISRDEFEYEIPIKDAEAMFASNMFESTLIEKTRYIVEYENFTWEVDVFHGANYGLIVAEVELESEDIVPPLPDWVGEEVSTDSRYYNSNLINNPYNTWSVANG